MVGPIVLKLHQLVVLTLASIQWSFSENGQSTSAEMHFENSKKSTSPRRVQMSILRPCLEVVASSVGMSTEADTLPVCCILEYSKWVEFLRKWSYHLFRGVRWKSKKIRIFQVHYGTISGIFKGLVWINGRANFAETAPIGCTIVSINPVEFQRIWSQHFRGHVFWKLQKIAQKADFAFFHDFFEKIPKILENDIFQIRFFFKVVHIPECLTVFFEATTTFITIFLSLSKPKISKKVMKKHVFFKNFFPKTKKKSRKMRKLFFSLQIID